MILQYQGFKNNWCYEEADTIVFAKVWVGKVTRDYRQGGIQHKIHAEELKKCNSEKERDSLKLKYVQEMQDAVNKLIKEETNCYDDIVYHTEGRFDEMENVAVVTLMDKNKMVTYVFDDGVYLLNSRGQTVRRIV